MLFAFMACDEAFGIHETREMRGSTLFAAAFAIPVVSAVQSVQRH